MLFSMQKDTGVKVVSILALIHTYVPWWSAVLSHVGVWCVVCVRAGWSLAACCSSAVLSHVGVWCVSGPAEAWPHAAHRHEGQGVSERRCPQGADRQSAARRHLAARTGITRSHQGTPPVNSKISTECFRDSMCIEKLLLFIYLFIEIFYVLNQLIQSACHTIYGPSREKVPK